MTANWLQTFFKQKLFDVLLAIGWKGVTSIMQPLWI